MTSPGNVSLSWPTPPCPATGGPRTRHHHRTRQAGVDRQRQRNRIHQHRDLRWAQQAQIAWHYIAPGKPTQNAFVESFNGRLRDELLNEMLFTSLAHAREALADWRSDFNTVRPHSGVGGLTPAIYAGHVASQMQRDGSTALCGGSAPRPVASPSQHGLNQQRTLLPAG